VADTVLVAPLKAREALLEGVVLGHGEAVPGRLLALANTVLLRPAVAETQAVALAQLA
jgi:hypothetical protein